jgi:hypothetical protein
MNCINCNNLTDNPKFCCRSCGVSYNNRIKPKRIKSKKQCILCKNEFCGSKKNRKFCSKKCHYEYKVKKIETSGSFSSNWNNNKSIRQYLIKKHGNYCFICKQSGDNWNGKTLTLIVDHIDGKADNWLVLNIRLVCPNCDSQLPTFKGRNIGNSTRKFTITQK